MPKLEALQRKYRDQGLAVVGVSDEAMGAVKKFMVRNPVEYTIAVSASGDAGSRYDVSSLPTLFIRSARRCTKGSCRCWRLK